MRKYLKKLIYSLPWSYEVIQYYHRLILPSISTSGEYWKKRYQKGGDSGYGSYNHLAEFKGEVINEFVDANNIGSVIEFGCGDGNQLKYFHLKKYIGYDISETAVSLCQKLYRHDRTKQFKLLSQYKSETADLVMSLDVIYHLLEDNVYFDYMERLFAASNRFVIIYSSDRDEYKHKRTSHVRHRKFTEWVQENAQEFQLIKFIPNKCLYSTRKSKGISLPDFYIYQQKEKEREEN